MRGGYLMAAALLPSSDLARARKSLTNLIMPGQRRIHFCSERDSRRREILSVVISLEPEVRIYDAGNHRSVKTARRACLEHIVDDLTTVRAERLIIERDSTTLDADRRWIFEQVRRTRFEALSYVHQRAHEEVLLAIPDAVAWGWAHNAKWRKLVKSLVSTVRRV